MATPAPDDSAPLNNGYFRPPDGSFEQVMALALRWSCPTTKHTIIANRSVINDLHAAVSKGITALAKDKNASDQLYLLAQLNELLVDFIGVLDAKASDADADAKVDKLYRFFKANGIDPFSHWVSDLRDFM